MYAGDGGASDKRCHVNVSDGVKISDNAANLDAGAFVSNVACTAMFSSVRFNNNTSSRNAGVAFLYQSASAVFVNCSLSNSTAKDGGAVHIEGNATVNFTSSTLNNHTAHHMGGALRVLDDAVAELHHSIVSNCSATSGGAIFIQDNGKVVLWNSSLRSNNATTGGAAHLLGMSDAVSLPESAGPKLRLNNSSCTDNSASSFGGCAYAVSQGHVQVDNSSTVAHNTAQYGGGVAFESFKIAPDVDPLKRAVHDNRAQMYGDNYYVDWANVQLLVLNESNHGSVLRPGSSLSHVIRSTGPGLRVVLKAESLSGSKYVKAAGIKVEAVLLDDNGEAALSNCSGKNCCSHNRDLDSATTVENGTATFPDMQPQQAPGNYSLVFRSQTLEFKCSSVAYLLQIRDCWLGEVRHNVTASASASGKDAWTCDVCPVGQYCLAQKASKNRHCHQCNSATTNCSAGGPVVFPLPGHWHKSPDSSVMTRCGMKLTPVYVIHDLGLSA